MQSILILEDDENLRGLLADTLGDEGYRVVEASSAEQAIALARESPFHLILSDVRMAGPLDGVGAIEKIKAFRPQIRSIVLTGYTDQDVPLRAAQIEADDYLFKPVGGTQLLDVVRLTLDRESSEISLLNKALQTPGELAQKAFAWLHDGKFQQLNQVRDRCFQRFFVLLRAKRLSAEEAYPVYLQLLETESRYHLSKPGDWGKLPADYASLEEQLLATLAQEPLSPKKDANLSWPRFQRLLQILQAGEVTAEQFQQSALLLLEPTLRRANLANYLTYQKLWALKEQIPPQTADALLGKTFGGYTLHKRLPEYTEVLVYSALNAAGTRRLVMAFPPEANPLELLQQDVQSGKASLLGSHTGYQIVLLNQQNHTLRQHLLPDGLTASAAWQLMRPIFLQIQAYHEKGVCSGTFSLDDIEVIPGQLPRLTRFSPDSALAHIREMEKRKSQGSIERQRLSLRPFPLEILWGSVAEPLPASDQAMLAFLLSRVLLGIRRSERLHLMLFIYSHQHLQSALEEAAVPPALQAVLHRMAQPIPTDRFPSLSAAIEAIDQSLAPRPLSGIIPAEGLSFKEAWRLLRPVFLQVQEYHQQGICSGSFTIRSLEVSPEGEARLPHFSPDQSLEYIARSRQHKRQVISELMMLPNEIAFGVVDQPVPASDQPALGRIFAQVLGGPSRPNWYQPSLLHTNDGSSWMELHTSYFKELTPCIYRLTRPQPEDRYPQISEAIEAIDAILFKETP